MTGCTSITTQTVSFMNRGVEQHQDSDPTTLLEESTDNTCSQVGSHSFFQDKASWASNV